jgi:hypothetical protein
MTEPPGEPLGEFYDPPATADEPDYPGAQDDPGTWDDPGGPGAPQGGPGRGRPGEPPAELPPELGRLTVLEELRSGGGQARRLRRCRREPDLQAPHETPTDVVVKVYEEKPGLADVWEVWRMSGEGVVPLLDARVVDGWAYEVTPFLPGGSLADRCRTYGAMRADDLERVVLQTAEALRHLHESPDPVPSQVLVHRDVKPGNLLVVDDSPLTVALTDFGVARLQKLQTEHLRFSGTVEYASPEALGADVCSPAGDWWALGITLLELLTGEHPLYGYRRMLQASAIRSHIVQRDIEVPERLDLRWRTLVAGLLIRDSANRWSYHQIARWLAGEPPTVTSGPTPAAESPSSGPRFGEPLAATFRPRLPFDGELYDDPVGLAGAMTRGWDRAAAFVVGVGWQDLRSWAHEMSSELGDSVEQVHRGYVELRRPVDRILTELLIRLDPRPPTVRGVVLDRPNLLRLAVAAVGGDLDACDVVIRLHRAGVLQAVAKLPGYEDLQLVDADWQRLVRRAEETATECLGSLDELAPAQALPALILGALLDRAMADQLRLQALASLNARTRRVGWFRGLIVRLDDPDGIAFQAVTVLAAPMAQSPEQQAAGGSTRRRRWFRGPGAGAPSSPMPAPKPAPQPRPGPSPRLASSPRPAPGPLPAPLPKPGPGPRPAAVPRRAPDPQPAPVPSRPAWPRPAPSPGPGPTPGPAPRPGGDQIPQPDQSGREAEG